MLLISAGASGLCCHLGARFRNQFEWLAPELSRVFCAIGSDAVQLRSLCPAAGSTPFDSPVHHYNLFSHRFIGASRAQEAPGMGPGCLSRSRILCSLDKDPQRP